MATATKFRDGLWLIEWNADLTSGRVEIVSCDQTSFQLECNLTDWDDVTLTVKQSKVAIKRKSVSSASRDATSSVISVRQSSSPLPKKVQASYANKMKEMVSTGQGTWANVSWPFKDTIFDPDQYYIENEYQFANFKLIVEFSENTSFAEGERHVLTHLSKLLDNQSMADVTFVVKNEKIGAHSAIVVSASPVLCAMLEKGNFKEGITREVKIDDIDPLVFKEMLRYLYTGRAPKLDEDGMTEPLFLAADKYQIEALKDLCEQRLIKKLNVKTVVHYLVVAHLYTAPQLLESSLVLMENHKNEVKACPEWKELMKNYPDLFFLAANRMIR